MVLEFSDKIHQDWDQDYARNIPKCLEDQKPCFILFRLDTKGQLGSDWLMLTYSPDNASIRDKMLFASTRATLKAEFGQGYIKDEFHVDSKSEAGLEGYRRHLANKAAPGPMTEVEQELHKVYSEERIHQEKANAARSLASQTLRGVAFPVDQAAEEKLGLMRDGKLNYVQLSVDTLNEAIKLEQFDNISVNQLGRHIPKNKPRYHFYVFKHNYDGELYNSVVFLYSMPNGGCTVKERMLYSSCKGPFLDTVERFIGLRCDRKVEIDTNEVVSEEFLMDQVHPQINLSQPLFAKPKPPGGRGLPRITRPVQ